MRLIEGSFVEPISLDEIKDRIGYSPTATVDDDFLLRNATAMRATLEAQMETLVTSRTITIYSEPCKCVRLPAPTNAILSVTATVDGSEVEVGDYFLWKDESVLTLSPPQGATDLTIIIDAGMVDTPSEIKEAILDLVKARYDRTPIEPVMADIRTYTYQYWRVSI